MPITLSNGDLAPNFVEKDVNGKSVKLTDYSNKRLLLVFFRYAGCPWCNLAIQRLSLEYPLLLAQGCRVIAFIQSSENVIKKEVYDRQIPTPPFPIIADPDKKIYDQYGVRNSLGALVRSFTTKLPEWIDSVTHLGRQTNFSGDSLLVPALFVIDKKIQKILYVDYGTTFYDHEAFTPIYESLTFGTSAAGKKYT